MQALKPRVWTSDAAVVAADVTGTAAATGTAAGAAGACFILESSSV